MSRFALALLAGASFAAISPLASAQVAGRTYNVVLQTSFGTHFNDCFEFSPVGGGSGGLAGTLTLPVAQGGLTLNYVGNGQGVLGNFRAVLPVATAAGIGFEVEFNGTGTTKTILAYGNDEFGDYYRINGTAGACTATSAPPAQVSLVRPR